MKRTLAHLAIALATPVVLAQANRADGEGRDWIPQTFPETLPEGKGPPARTAPTVLSAAWLDAFVENENIRELDAPGAEEVAAANQRRAERYADIKPGPARMGFVRDLASPVSAPGPEWKEQTLADGRRVWTLAIVTPGARNIRVHFRDVQLGKSSMTLHTLRENQVVARGPFTGAGPEGRGEFWAPTLPGDTARIEIVGGDAPQLLIDAVLHEDIDYAHEDFDPRGDCTSVCSCHLDVMCEDSPPVHPVARQATGRMGFISGGNSYVCTGTMLSDFDSATYVPHFLTAAHCLSTQSEVNTLEVTWFYQSNNSPSNCNSSPFVPSRDNFPQTHGGRLLYETGPPALTNDACFIRLNPDELPNNANFAGSTANQESGVAGIHHPQGDWKRFCAGVFEDFSIGCGADCGCFDSANYAFYDLTRGIVQGGSSGSGMFNSSGQIIGQLFGHCTLCPDAEDCAHSGDWCLMYGEWEETYPEIEYWLNLGGTIWVNRSSPGSQNGLLAFPFRTVSAAYNLAWNDTRLMILPGTYAESLTMSKRITLNAPSGVVRIGG